MMTDKRFELSENYGEWAVKDNETGYTRLKGAVVSELNELDSKNKSLEKRITELNRVIKAQSDSFSKINDEYIAFRRFYFQKVCEIQEILLLNCDNKTDDK